MPITIGIPFYNAEAYLADAIRSVFAQTYHDWELILVDDGSTDRSLEIARSIKDERVRVLSDGQNRRLPYRLNQITLEAKYDFIGRMDADDLISPTRFEKQIGVLETNSNIDLVTTGICSISRDKKPNGIRCASSTIPLTMRNLLLGKCMIVHAAILGRRSWFLRNPYDPSVRWGQDYDLWIRSLSKGDLRINFLKEPLYYYREEENIIPEKTLSAYRHCRSLTWKYGHLGLSPLEKLYLMSLWHLKSSIVHLLSATGNMNFLLKRRNRVIDDQKLYEKLALEIQTISQTKLAGFD